MRPDRLQQIRLRNFKAIQDSGPIRLTPLSVFVGNNGSGKSSVVEGLETLQLIVEQGLDRALQRWRDIEHVWNKARSHTLKDARRTKNGVELVRPYHTHGIEFRLRGRSADGTWSAALEVNQEPAGNALYIRRERLRVHGGLQFDRNAIGRGRSVRPGMTEPRLYRYSDGESGFARDFAGFIGGWQFLSLSPDNMGSPTPRQRTGGRIRLARDGSNVAEYLLDIRDHDATVFEGILEALQYVLPYIRDLQMAVTQEIERAVYFRMTEQKFHVPGWTLSTGTLRLIALLAVLRHPDPPPLVVIEELENGLDPRTLNLVVEEIRRAVELGLTQVIVTTHSEYLLNLLDISQIVLVERVDGVPTFIRPADSEELSEWANSFAPGQLYTMGRFRGLGGQ